MDRSPNVAERVMFGSFWQIDTGVFFEVDGESDARRPFPCLALLPLRGPDFLNRLLEIDILQDCD